MNETLILASVFVSVLIVSALLIGFVNSRKQISDRLQEAKPTYLGGSSRDTAQQLERLISSENEYISHYFEVIAKNNLNSVEYRLIRAGYFSKSAPRTFNLIRIGVSLLALLGAYFLITNFFVAISSPMAIVLSMFVSGVFFILVNAVLDRMGQNRQVTYRKMFPEFMDMLVVCVDAGMSIDAALNRVAVEFLQTNPDFGTHLNIMMLEVRAGRSLRNALSNFADRLNIEEAKSLAILFRQSEELGSSVTKTLRVFSSEMRTKRMIRAEEKANSLPIKMLFPLALFLFPTNLIIVLVPIVIRVANMFLTLAPN
ncbi:MAG: type II secretion system F family protein [Rhizobiaceae bacterium]